MIDLQIGEEISFLASFFNFFYYLLLIPFKTILDKETNEYRIQSNTLHKICCSLIHTIVVFFVISLWIISGRQFETNLEPRIVVLFDLVSNFTSSLSTILIIFILWRRREKYLQVIESTRITVPRARPVKIALYFGTLVSSIAWGVINWFMLHDDKHYGSLHSLDKYILDRCAFSDNITNATSPYLPIFEYTIHAGLDIVMVHSSLLYIPAYGSFLMLILALGQLGKTFEIELEATNDVQKGNSLHKSFKRKTELIKDLFGNNLLTYYITSICYYAEAPHVLLGKRGDTEKAIMIYVACTSVIWILAAEFHKNIEETVLKWIASHAEKAHLSTDDRLKLVYISNEMSTNPVALSSRYFCVTYKQFSAMLGLVMTYGIIVFQLHSGPHCKDTY